jgi:haloalkane dehalogenase
VLLLHGNPTWSFLYRKVIAAVRHRCRCIAPDYPGFGLSDHPSGYSYRPFEHAQWIAELLERLELGPFLLVGHDWGGPIGLSLAVQQPERVKGIVLSNTWCWPPELRVRIFSWTMGGPFGKYLNLRHNFFARVIVRIGIARPEARSKAVLRAYADRFPDRASRQGTYVFPRSLRTDAAWLSAIEGKLPVLRHVPVELVWGLRDPAFGHEGALRKWKRFFPGARIDRVAGASHYVPEDRPDRIAEALLRIVG